MCLIAAQAGAAILRYFVRDIPVLFKEDLEYVFMPVIGNRTVWYLPIRESLELAGLLGSRVDVGIGPQTILKHYF